VALRVVEDNRKTKKFYKRRTSVARRRTLQGQ
jgi:hypothetical protein